MNIIEIGESMEYLSYILSSEGLSIKQITGLTGLPTEFVSMSIDNYTNI